MSFFEAAKRAVLGPDAYDDYEYDDYEEEYEEEEEPKKGFFSIFSRKKDRDDYEDEYEEEEPRRSYDTRRSYDSSRSYRSSSGGSDRSYTRSGGPYERTSSQIRYERPSDIEVKVLYPTHFDDSSALVREVKAGKITIFDVSGIPSNEDARRVVDYISGAAAGMECPFSRLCPSIFCIAPKGVRLNVSAARNRA